MTDLTKQPKRKRRFFRFSLRSFLIAFTFFGVVIGPYIYRAEQQREAVKWVEKNGGVITYDYDYDYDYEIVFPFHGSQPPRNPRNWMERILGIDYFADVVSVSFSDTKLKQTGITKNDWTEPTGTQLDDLAPLSGLTNLETLSLSGIRVTDLTPLSNLKKLKTLQLLDCQVRDLSPLTELTSLQILELMGNPFDDLTPLAGLANLHTLEISSTNVTDLSPLSGLQSLTSLWFCDTKIEDVSPLEGLTELSSLRLTNTNVSYKDAKELRRARPDCFVFHFKAGD